jgi:hypothetical protein
MLAVDTPWRSKSSRTTRTTVAACRTAVADAMGVTGVMSSG